MARRSKAVRPPSTAEIQRYAAEFHFDLTDEELEVFSSVIERRLGNYARIDALGEPRRTRTLGNRDPGYRPDDREDPDNAFVTKCRVEGATKGPLAGLDVGLKDNIAVAGVEMTCGSRVLEGYVPVTDATVVGRLLDAGATITGKLNMEDMAVSSSGDNSALGPVTNPHDRGFLAGGSSSGSAVAVVNGDVDVSLGTDQGGSIRIPAAVCGCVGLKPSFGLVPYTGIVGAGYSYDHVGPMAKSTELVARTLDVLAGPDPDDPRQGAFEPPSYTDGLGADPTAVSLCVLEEGFDGVDEAVAEVVEGALRAAGSAGMAVEDRSVPLHDHGKSIRNAIATEAFTATVRGEGVGHFVDGWYDTHFANAFATARRTRANEFPPNAKLKLLMGAYLGDRYFGRFHARAHNLSRDLAEAYDDALDGVDVLALPTTPRTAYEAVEDLSLEESLGRGSISNTAPFNVTGHPAISVPCGLADGLPVGLMLVGERFDDATVLGVADAFERAVGSVGG